MTPEDIGLPFQDWRPYQYDALLDVQGAGRFVGLSMPTGSGKSAVYMALSSLCEGRTVILTSTKGLQDQLTEEFPTTADMRGKANYLCNLESPRVPVPEGICHLGFSCHLKGAGCDYFDAYRRASTARVVVTNYAFWMACHEYQEGLGGFDQMILDEAHNAHDELSDFLAVEVSRVEIDAFLWKLKEAPTLDTTWEWATAGLILVEEEITDLRLRIEQGKKSRMALQRVKELSSLKMRLERLTAMNTEGVVLDTDSDYKWTPVDVRDQNFTLFRGIKKVVFVSATMREKTMQMLGITNGSFLEYPSVFPRSRRMVHYIPTVRVQYNMSSAEMSLWVDRIDQIIERNLDRKGIIHTVSYARRDYLMKHSRYADLMITHQRRDTPKKVAEFKRAQAPAILVSPSMTTGWDFPYQECEFQIIAKVPFPSQVDPVVKARSEVDKTYGHYLAAIELVQAAGRGMRAADDQCTTYIIDDHYEWFHNKMRRFAPRWYLEAVQFTATIPSPLPPLRAR